MKLPLWRRRRSEEELEEEIQSHLQMAIRDRMERGESAEEAELAARQEFGNVGLIKETTRGMWGWAEARLLLDDMRYGLRMLRKSPGWTAVMCAVLALGIGLTTAIFSLTYGALLRALPYPDPERVVALYLTNTVAAAAGFPRFNVNAVNWIEWREQSKLFEDIALARVATNFNLTGDGPPERVQGARASWNLTRTLGVQPLLGRAFTEEETLSDAKVAVLSYGFWDRRFARDPSIVGRKILLNDESFEVIGVMPPNFRYPTREFDLLAPLFITPDEIRTWGHFYYRAVGRLKPGVSLRQAQAEMSAITERLAEQRPRGPGAGKDGAWVESLLDSYVGQFRTTLYILLATVGCLLLICLINLGGLLIVRANARTREFAVRAALGASAARLRRQTLAEALPLSLAGAGAGALLAWLLLNVLVKRLPPQLPDLETIGLHAPALAFALASSVLVTLLAGMLPARLASRARLAAPMRQDSRMAPGGGMVRNALVAAQVAVTLALVFAGGLLTASLVAVMRVNPGFSPQNALTMSLPTSRARYNTEPQVAEYYQRLAARVKTIPGVIEAGVASRLPFSGNYPSGPVEFEDKPNGTANGEFCSVTPGYFSAMGIPLIRGRDFTERDKEGAPPVAIIDEQLARKVFGNEDPLGRRIRFAVITDRTPWIEIVGVVGHIRSASLETDPRLQVYWPKAQLRPETQRQLESGTLVVRTAGRPESFSSAVVEQIQKENPDQPVYDVRSMQDRLDQSLQSRNLMTGLVSLFGGSALLLACLGLYGVVAYGARLRLREFAIRAALGAQANDIRWIVLAHTLRLWMFGSAIGLILAWMAGRALKTQLYGVGSADSVALAVAPALLLVIALLAGLGPARRAGRVDPAVTLRSE
jgi:putative ABC transport system permease protein